MRLALAAATAGLSALVLLAARPLSLPPTAAQHTVTVNATCSGQAVQLSVDPWILRLSLGDSVSWRLTSTSNADSIWVDRKVGPRWPFTRSPQGGNRARPAYSGGPANLRGRHHYNIYLACTLGADTTVLVVDPDMIIQ